MFALAAIAEQASTASDYERATLACLRNNIDFDVGFFVRGDRVGPGPLDVDSQVVEATRAQFGGYGRELLRVTREAVRHGIATDIDVLGARALARTQVYREFMSPQGGSCSLLAPLSFRGKQLGLLVLGRRRNRFSQSEQAALKKHLPALRLCDAIHAPSLLLSGLTSREREVLQYLCLGYTNAEIARACATSVNTVRNQLQSVYRKLGATTRAEAVGMALSGRS